MPVLDGKLRNSSIAASNPPAEPPIPAIGQAKPCGFERALRRTDFECADFLRLAFIGEGDALRFSSCFAVMAVVHVSGPLLVIQASIPPVAAVSNRRGEQKARPQRALLQAMQSQCLPSSRRTPGGHTFFDQIALNLPQPERRQQEPVDFFSLRRFVTVHDLRPQCFQTLARWSGSAFEF